MYNPRKVLVVDDDPVCRAILAYWINKAGFEAYLAASGEEALRIVNESHHALVLDMHMGVGALNGNDVAMEVIERGLHDIRRFLVYAPNTTTPDITLFNGGVFLKPLDDDQFKKLIAALQQLDEE